MANCSQCGRRLPSLWFGKKLCQWCVRHQAAQRAAASGVGEDDAMQPVMAPPWMVRERALPVSITHLLVGINVAVYIAMVLAGVSPTEPNTQQLLHWGANYGPQSLGAEPWRLLTSCFVHSGIIHIGFNMWCLWSLGQLAESLYGPWTFAGLYLVSGVASMLASALWRFNGVSVGASGAVFAVAGALAASFYLGEFSLPRDAIKGQLSSLVMFIGYNLLFGAVAGHIDNAAHIGGLVIGAILGAFIARAAPDHHLWGRRAAGLGVVLLLVVATTGLVAHSRAYRAHQERGLELLREGKVAEAIPELQASTRLRPGYTDAHFALAYAYSLQKNWPAAEAELKQILSHNASSAAAYYQLGLLYRDMHRPDDAKQAFMNTLKYAPNAADARVGLGALLADQHDYRTALQEFQAAAEIDPGADHVFYNMGLSYSNLGDYDDAIAAFQKEIEISGEQSDTESALAAAYRAKGMTAEAEAAEHKVSKVKPREEP